MNSKLLEAISLERQRYVDFFTEEIRLLTQDAKPLWGHPVKEIFERNC